MQALTRKAVCRNARVGVLLWRGARSYSSSITKLKFKKLTTSLPATGEPALLLENKAVAKPEDIEEGALVLPSEIDAVQIHPDVTMTRMELDTR